MRSAFEAEAAEDVGVKVQFDGGPHVEWRMRSTGPASGWQAELAFDLEKSHVAGENGGFVERGKPVDLALAAAEKHIEPSLRPSFRNAVSKSILAHELQQLGMSFDFRIYAPENSALRFFQAEPQAFPLDPKGAGLYSHLKELGEREDGASLANIADRLSLLDWFEHFEIPKDLVAFERSIVIRDRYLAEGALFDQRSANEGFLFLLFYFTLLISPNTPRFFAIDNIDTSLNPKLCTELMRQIVDLAKTHDKQVILTTHNPAMLDGLNLKDDDQRLLVVYRTIDGDTTARRVGQPRQLGEQKPVPLSQAFVRGYIGGLPDNF